MARAFLRSFKAHSYSYATKMIDKNAPSGCVRSSRGSAAQTPSISSNQNTCTWSKPLASRFFDTVTIYVYIVVADDTFNVAFVVKIKCYW